MGVEELSAEDVASRAMNVAADMCVFTNSEFISYSLDDRPSSSEDDESND